MGAAEEFVGAVSVGAIVVAAADGEGSSLLPAESTPEQATPASRPIAAMPATSFRLILRLTMGLISGLNCCQSRRVAGSER